MDKMFFLFIGYTFIWALIFFYTLLLGRRQNQVAEELELLKKTLKDQV